MRYFIFAFLLFVICESAFSQTSLLDFSKRNYGLIVRKLDESNGFPSTIAQEFLYDQNGFFWFATSGGLIKYDGITSELFDAENTRTLENSAINHICEDKHGNIWLSYHVRGLSIKRGKEFYSFGRKENLPELTVSEIFTDANGITWIGSLQDGLYKFINNKFQKITLPSNQLLNNILSIYNYKADTILAGTGFGLLKVAGEKADIFSLPEMPSLWCRSIFIDSKKRLWIGTNKGLAVYFDEKRIYKNIFAQFANDLVTKFEEDRNGNIWIATYNRGIFIFNESTQKLFPFNKEHGLSDDKISFYKIINNYIWSASRTGGVDVLKPAVFDVVSADHGLLDEFVNCIYEDSPGNYLAGTTKGLYKISLRGKLFYAEKIPKLENDHIYFIKRDKKNNLLVATRTSGVHLFANNSQTVYNMNNILRVNFVRSIFIDDDNTYWFGTNGAGVSVVNGGKARYFDQTNGLDNAYTSFIFKRRNGEFVIGTSGGGLYFIRDGKIVKNLKTQNGLSSNIISGYYEEEDGALWFSSPEGGVMRIKDSIIKSANRKDGLHSNNIFNMIYDGKNKFWFSTQSGIFSVAKKDLENFFDGGILKITSEIYGKSDGMLSENCSFATQLSAIRATNGNIFVSTLKGLVVIEPENIVKRKEKIETYISKFVWNEDRLTEGKEIGPGVNRLEINFSAKTMIEPRFINFKYKLEPVDASFSQRALTNNAVYTNLAHGDYKFILIASKGSEAFSADTLRYSFTIQPYFYETLLFRIFAILFLTVIITAVIVSTVRKSYAKKLNAIEGQHQLEKERMRISKDMHDELGAIVTRINLLSEVGKQNLNDADSVKTYLNQISETGIELASTMDEIVWAVNPGNDRIDKLIFYIIQFAESMLSLGGINLSVSVPDEIESKFTHAEIRHNIFLIVKEVINNIIKHSEAKNVRIEASMNKNLFELTVSDDGKGFSMENIDKFSNGIVNMNQRAKSVNGFIKIDSKLNEGTKIFLSATI